MPAKRRSGANTSSNDTPDMVQPNILDPPNDEEAFIGPPPPYELPPGRGVAAWREETILIAPMRKYLFFRNLWRAFKATLAYIGATMMYYSFVWIIATGSQDGIDLGSAIGLIGGAALIGASFIVGPPWFYTDAEWGKDTLIKMVLQKAF